MYDFTLKADLQAKFLLSREETLKQGGVHSQTETDWESDMEIHDLNVMI